MHPVKGAVMFRLALPVERSRPAAASRPESLVEPANAPPHGAAAGRAFGLAEVHAVASGTGLDPGLVRPDLRALDDGPGQGLGAALAGAPLRRVIEREVDGEVGGESQERLSQEIRNVLSSTRAGSHWVLPGGISSIGRSLTLSGFTGTSSLEVDVAPREGKTLIRLSSDRSQLAGGLFGGIVGGVGGGFGANVGWMIPTLLHLPAAAGLLGAALVVLGAYLLARGIFVTNARSLDRKLDALADRLEAVARQTTERRSMPSAIR